MQKLKKFEFREAVGRAVYDWNTLLDGNIYQGIEGEDFQCKAATFGLMLRTRSEKRGKGCRVNQETKENEEGVSQNIVTWQAFDYTPEQLAERAERSAQRKAQRAAKSGAADDEDGDLTDSELEAALEAEQQAEEQEPEPEPKPVKPAPAKSKGKGGKGK